MSLKKINISRLQGSCESVAEILRAMAHPQRLMILGHLSQGDKTVSQLQDLCEISQSQLSQFLARMRLEGLLQCQRRGRFQYYSVADKKITNLIGAIHKIFCS